MAPHSPITIDANGNLIPYNQRPQFSDSSYLEQIKGINVNILKVVNKILNRYPENKKPIIIIQGDHGYRYLKKLQNSNIEGITIFNAYYLPQNGNSNIYQEISPYNTFRLIFDIYFQGDMKILPDIK